MSENVQMKAGAHMRSGFSVAGYSRLFPQNFRLSFIMPLRPPTARRVPRACFLRRRASCAVPRPPRFTMWRRESMPNGTDFALSVLPADSGIFCCRPQGPLPGARINFYQRRLRGSDTRREAADVSGNRLFSEKNSPTDASMTKTYSPRDSAAHVRRQDRRDAIAHSAPPGRQNIQGGMLWL